VLQALKSLRLCNCLPADSVEIIKTIPGKEIIQPLLLFVPSVKIIERAQPPPFHEMYTAIPDGIDAEQDRAHQEEWNKKPLEEVQPAAGEP
jgi:hypothetical protein